MNSRTVSPFPTTTPRARRAAAAFRARYVHELAGRPRAGRRRLLPPPKSLAGPIGAGATP